MATSRGANALYHVISNSIGQCGDLSGLVSALKSHGYIIMSIQEEPTAAPWLELVRAIETGAYLNGRFDMDARVAYDEKFGGS